MAANKPKPIAKGTTPKGVLAFPFLNKPDTKFKADGEYRTKLRLGGEAAAELQKTIDAAYDAAVKQIKAEMTAKGGAEAAKAKKIKLADKPYKPAVDKDGNETGETEFTFKQKAKITAKNGDVFEKKIDLFDAAKQRLSKDVLVYGGTVAKVAFEAWPFFTAQVGAGVTLRLCAVQVIELKTGGARDADDYGFGEEGDGLPTDTSGEGNSEGEEGGDEPDEF